VAHADTTPRIGTTPIISVVITSVGQPSRVMSPVHLIAGQILTTGARLRSRGTQQNQSGEYGFHKSSSIV